LNFFAFQIKTDANTKGSKKTRQYIVAQLGVEAFKLPMIEEGDDTQLMTLVGLGCGVYGILQKSRYAVWIGLLANLYAMLNAREGVADTRTYFSTVGFSVIGLVMIYANLFTAPGDSSIFYRPSN
jgi:hypothetical protein